MVIFDHLDRGTESWPRRLRDAHPEYLAYPGTQVGPGGSAEVRARIMSVKAAQAITYRGSACISCQNHMDTVRSCPPLVWIV